MALEIRRTITTVSIRQTTFARMRVILSMIATQALFRKDRTDKEIQARRQEVVIVDKREKSCQSTYSNSSKLWGEGKMR